jgi:hypothetical protein
MGIGTWRLRSSTRLLQGLQGSGSGHVGRSPIGSERWRAVELDGRAGSWNPRAGRRTRPGDALHRVGVGGTLGLAPGGAAGIGKTTWWHAGVSFARARGHRVLSCRAAESEARLSYAALGDRPQGHAPIHHTPGTPTLEHARLRAEHGIGGTPHRRRPGRARSSSPHEAVMSCQGSAGAILPLWPLATRGRRSPSMRSPAA